MISILVDGYNLLSGAGIVANADRPFTLERSRQALLSFLVHVLGDEERRQTTVVFDAKQAPPGLPRSFTWQEIQVLFAPRGQEADTVIVELIAQNTAPRQLMVVSSDHAIQRAARRRRARFSDSDRWFRDRLRKLRATDKTNDDLIAARVREQKQGPLSEAEVARWLAEFDDASSGPATTRAEETRNQRPVADDHFNPFPEGYAEDLLDEE